LEPSFAEYDGKDIFNFIATSNRAGSANNSVNRSCVHIPDSYKLVEEIHIHSKIGGGFKSAPRLEGKQKKMATTGIFCF
jgi:hypothetical protein